MEQIQGYGPGDRVLYHPVGNSLTASVGYITEILTDPEVVGQERPVTIHADSAHPRVVIRNEHTGKTTAYRPQSIIRKVASDEIFPHGFGLQVQSGELQEHEAGSAHRPAEPSREYEGAKMEYPQPRKVRAPLSPGQRVVYHPVAASPATSTGVVTEVITAPNVAAAGSKKEMPVHAAENYPRVVIRDDHTGQEVLYPLESLISVE